MNQFRDLSMVALLAFGTAMIVSKPAEWNWLTFTGPQVISYLVFLDSLQPFPSVVCFAVAMVLFMTRLKY